MLFLIFCILYFLIFLCCLLLLWNFMMMMMMMMIIGFFRILVCVITFYFCMWVYVYVCKMSERKKTEQKTIEISSFLSFSNSYFTVSLFDSTIILSSNFTFYFFKRRIIINIVIKKRGKIGQNSIFLRFFHFKLASTAKK